MKYALIMPLKSQNIYIQSLLCFASNEKSYKWERNTLSCTNSFYNKLYCLTKYFGTKKEALQVMVTSKEWTTSTYAKEIVGKKMCWSCFGFLFWKECFIIVKVTKPLVLVLSIIDGDDILAMGFIYEAINKARKKYIKISKEEENSWVLFEDCWFSIG